MQSLPRQVPSPRSIMILLQQILDTLPSSNIVEKGANDERSRFWTVYQKVASQHDNEFLEQYDGDMDIVLIFSSRKPTREIERSW
ncbi:uncharacterized protein HD556DRAFT_54531 [Suillus plorans]|uniref:Uncharacterized protein n=1 Tax=Suillus plorans TaxID=116603 RepID=A0A9P7J9S2_9AGAM|nr:uncharacterized protein HD556DRAFT_54531 [Suillus plorans]KAG1810451.1 hypothetical protein HD556DRAFT_54531 [Suillus plorans]